MLPYHIPIQEWHLSSIRAEYNKIKGIAHSCIPKEQMLAVIRDSWQKDAQKAQNLFNTVWDEGVYPMRQHYLESVRKGMNARGHKVPADDNELVKIIRRVAAKANVELPWWARQTNWEKPWLDNEV